MATLAKIISDDANDLPMVEDLADLFGDRDEEIVLHSGSGCFRIGCGGDRIRLDGWE